MQGSDEAIGRELREEKRRICEFADILVHHARLLASNATMPSPSPKNRILTRNESAMRGVGCEEAALKTRIASNCRARRLAIEKHTFALLFVSPFASFECLAKGTNVYVHA